MKQIKILIFLMLLGWGAQAQFISTDSIKTYIDKYIGNNATTAFQNKRLNTALKGLASLLDSVDARVVGGVRTVDSLWKYNDSTLAFRIKGQTYTLSGLGGSGSGAAFTGLSHDPTTTGLGTPGSPLKVDTSANKIATKTDLRLLKDSITFIKDTLKVNRSITTRASGADTLIELVGDETAPTPYKYYGTGALSLKGFQPLPVANLSVTPNADSVFIANAWGAGVKLPFADNSTSGVLRPIDYFNLNNKVGQTQFLDSVATLRALAISGGGSGGGAETDPLYISEKPTLVKTTDAFVNPGFITSIPYTKVTGTSGIITDIGSYSNPSWITALDNSKITGLSALLAAKSDATHNHSVDALVNVNTTGKASGDLLSWNGTAWAKLTPFWLTTGAGDIRYAPLAHNTDAATLTTGSIPAGRFGNATVPVAAINATGGATGRYLTYDGTWAVPVAALANGDYGDITVGTGTLTIDAASVTTSKLAVQATNTFIGRVTAGTNTPEILTATQATSILNPFTSTLKGLVPASGGGTTTFLRADGTFATPASGTVTPGGSSTQVQLNVGSAFVGDASFTYDTATNILAVPTIKLSPVFSYLAPTSIRAVGNSITVGLNASPQTDSGYVYRLGASMTLSVNNNAVGGRGIWEAARAHYANVAPGHSEMTVVMAAFNDLRRGGTAYKTVRKILNGHKAIFANHFMKSFKSASDAAIVKYGSWSTYTASAVGGKSTGTNARYTSGVNDSAVYVFTDSTIVIGLLAGDGVTNIYSDFEVFIDGVSKGTFTENNQIDAISDGSNDNARGAMALYFNQLGYSSHKVKVVNKGNGFFILDYFGHLVDIANATPLLIMHVPKMDATGYATSPNASSDAVTNSMNASLDSLVLTMPAGYPVFVGQTNSFYNVATGLDPADHIHPNNTGHRQIFNAAVAAIPANVTSLPIGTVGVGADSYLFASKNGVKTKIAFLDDIAAGGGGTTKPLDSVLVAGATIPARTITQTGVTTFTGSRVNVDSLKAGSVYIGDNPPAGHTYAIGMGKVTANNNPYIFLKNSSSSTNEKVWDFYSTGANLFGRATADDGSGGFNWLEVNRTGTSLNYVKIPTQLWVSSGSIKFPDNTVQSTAFAGNQFTAATGGLYTLANIGIGTTTPHDATFNPALRVSGSSGLNMDVVGNGYSRIWFRDISQTTDHKNYEILNLSSIFSISRANDAATSRTYRFVIADNGNVGIGNNNAPNYPLEVMGTISSTTGGFRFPDGTTQTTAATGSAPAYTAITSIPAATLVGRYTASTGTGQGITLGSGLSLDNSTGVLTAAPAAGVEYFSLTNASTYTVSTANGKAQNLVNDYTAGGTTYTLPTGSGADGMVVYIYNPTVNTITFSQSIFQGSSSSSTTLSSTGSIKIIYNNATSKWYKIL